MIKKYWIELLVFLAIATVLLTCMSPQITWMNTDSDGAHYILASKYMTTAHNTSAPLYLLLGRLFHFLPFGTDAWKMGLISVIGTLIAVSFIYLIVRKLLSDNPKVRWYAIIASILYGSSALVISQSTIIETYPLVTGILLGAYYFILQKRWYMTSIFIGIGMAIHPLLSGLIWLIYFIAHKELRKWKPFLITFSFALFYLYIPIVGIINPNEHMWNNTSIDGFFRGNFGTLFMLSGGLSMWDLPKRIIDTLLILGISLGLGLVLSIWQFAKTHRLRYELMWLMLIPTLYFTTNLSAETYVYLIMAVAFGSIVSAIALSKIRWQYAMATLLIALGLWGFNANYLDIGRTLDPEMSAMKFYNEELSKIPDGEIYMGGGWTWAMVFLYNREEGRNIIPICTDTLPSDKYLDILESQGIKLTRYPDTSYITKEGSIAVSIAEQNEHVWISKVVKPEVYQYEIVPAKDNIDYIGRWIGQELTPSWQFKPSNPYKYITGQLEVVEWHHILMSNKNAVFVIFCGLCGYTVFWVFTGGFRRKKHEIRNKEKETTTTR